jgi:hypothetical protein
VSQFTKNILVVATQLRKSKIYKKKEGSLAVKSYDWSKTEDFLNIEKQVKANIDFFIPILPLKFSNGFDVVDDEEKSIKQLVESSKLHKHYYQTEANQLSEIYKLIDTYA